MEGPLASTVWPRTPIPENVKRLLLRFLHLIDLNDPHAGRALADEVFSSNGVFQSPGGLFRGSQDIILCREDAWNTIASRSHTIDKVFSGNADGTELIVVGKLFTQTKDTLASTAVEFSAQVEIEASDASSPRMKTWKAYSGNRIQSGMQKA
ncbi:hypothetical protein RBB50_002121 [Rhinocladiella similis]